MAALTQCSWVQNLLDEYQVLEINLASTDEPAFVQSAMNEICDFIKDFTYLLSYRKPKET